VPNQFASGKFAISQCDRCGFRFQLKVLKTEIIKTKKYDLKVCPACWDPDQPQLQLGMYPIEDPQALRNPRPDNTYYQAGYTGLQLNQNAGSTVQGNGDPTGGSRVFQWGWAPVGGASSFATVLTPNYLIALGQTGTVTVITT
jgi:hypothetical protein